MYKNMTIKDMVKNKTARFVEYKKDNLWYCTDDGFEFPVPISDIGDGIFQSSEKAMTLMRYIRIHLNNIEKGKQDAINSQGISV